MALYVSAAYMPYDVDRDNFTIYFTMVHYLYQCCCYNILSVLNGRILVLGVMSHSCSGLSGTHKNINRLL
jgi:hypothetical protein